ncbi:replication-relaxation family protein, partial [Nocardia carnea]|uniref:replication-relaxation family protein n=1 Tax=Nocardia carnea TaxID=37328 RepID=UPI0024538CAF
LLFLPGGGGFDRFQPLRPWGSAPDHWVLARAGAAVGAAEGGLDMKNLHYRHDRALAVAHSLHLAHTLGINDWFTTLITTPNGGGVVAWWSETRCRHLWGDLVAPDAYGRYAHGGTVLDFFLEYDLATINLSTVANKLAGYAELARSTGIITPVLLWVPSTSRETSARHALHDTWRTLADPTSVPVATAAADMLNPRASRSSPADRVWLPLDDNTGERVALHQLRAAWPHLTPAPVTTDRPEPIDTGAPKTLAAPPPTPPHHAGGS